MNEVLNNKKKSEILAEKIRELNYGDIISYKQIENVIEEEYRSNRYNSTISKARKILVKQGVNLENIRGDGYRITEPDQFVGQALKNVKSGFNKIQKGYDTLEYAPVKDMSIEGREIHRRVYDRMVSLKAAMNGARVELNTLAEKKRHPFAVENVR